jgi:hypothetical protein
LLSCRPWTTFLPLGIVLGAAMIKEAVEDYRRHKQDVEVNNRKVEVSIQQTWRPTSWHCQYLCSSFSMPVTQ